MLERFHDSEVTLITGMVEMAIANFFMGETVALEKHTLPRLGFILLEAMGDLDGIRRVRGTFNRAYTTDRQEVKQPQIKRIFNIEEYE